MKANEKRLRLSMSSRGLRLWGLIFLTAGMIGRGIVQNVLLGVDTVGMDRLAELLEQDPTVLKYTTIAVLLQGIETFAVPIFAFLLVEGFRHTSNFKAYLTRVFCVALLAELPYNLVTTGNWIASSSRNPVFALVIGLIIMLFFTQNEGTSVKSALSKGLVIFAAGLWTLFLGIQNGIPIVLFVSVLWLCRSSRNKQVWVGVAACIVCGFLSSYYFASAVGMLMLLLYSGERGNVANKWVNYLAYPVLLLAVGVAAMLM